ncbi:MAG: peptide chain release factor 1 [Trueperaceae bacterium]|nr:peptide chain release factor 1 [Trueperaceae bacterium]
MTISVRPVLDELAELEAQLGDQEVIGDPARYRAVMQRYGELKPAAELASAIVAARRAVGEAEAMLVDTDMRDMALEELERLSPELERLEEQFQRQLVAGDPYDDDDVILEVRAAAGGDEASLFAAEVLQMYLRYASTHGLKAEVLDSHPTDVGGLTKVAVEIKGGGAYRRFKFESGVHRVQRVPTTEAQGRIHTSTVTVAVLPEAEDVDVALSPADYRVDVYRSSGPGGQSVNTTDSAVRITYAPGTADEIVVTCQDGKSQLKNKEKALTVLRARLLERERARAAAEEREARLVQIGSGERSEKIRTYNFPQSRVTDHRIGYTTHDLAGVMGGDLDTLTAALERAEQDRRLAHLDHGHRDGARPGSSGEAGQHGGAA